LIPRGAVAEGSCRGLSTMTIAERLRTKNKVLKVEELADLLGVAKRTGFGKVKPDGKRAERGRKLGL
jgi:hypothetical protein